MCAILLDLDDTLLDDRRAAKIAYSQLVSDIRTRIPSPSDDTLRANWLDITRHYWQRYEQGEISFAEQRQRRFSAFLGAEFSASECDNAIQRYITRYASAWQLFPGVSAFLTRTAHHPKAVITNGERAQQIRKLRATGVMAHIDAVITPEDCGVWKPNAEIFLYAAKILNVKPSACHMIGDDLVRDIAPAQLLGMQVHHIPYESGVNGLINAIEIV